MKTIINKDLFKTRELKFCYKNKLYFWFNLPQ